MRIGRRRTMITVRWRSNLPKKKKIRQKPWHIEEIIDQRRSTDGYENYKDYDDSNLSKITTRFKEFYAGNKSKSENDISRGFVGNKCWCKENDEDLTSPSDSKVTIVRVQRRSQTQKIILAKHTPDRSPSMVNLATMLQRYDTTSIISKNDRLVSLSSWDGNEIPVSTVSDSGIYVSRALEKDPRASLLSFTAWKRYCLANKGRKSIETRVDVNKKMILESIPLHHGFTNMAGNPRKICREIENHPHQLSADEISYDLNLLTKKKKNSLKLSERMEKAFQRFVKCSWVFRNVKKYTEENNENK